MTPTQKQAAEQYLVGKGLVKGGGAQYGGFLGLLASIGVPLAISLVKKYSEKACKLNHHAHDHDDHPDPDLQRKEECKCDPYLSSELGMIIKKNKV